MGPLVGIALKAAAPYIATMALPMIMSKIAGGIIDKGTTRKVSRFRKGPNAGKVKDIKIIETKAAKGAKPFKGLGDFLQTGVGVLLPSLLSGLATGASAAGRAAGSAANAVANAPKAFLAGTATPQQEAIYGKNFLEPFANVASFAGEPANTALSGVGDAVANTVGNFGRGISSLEQRRLMDKELENQFERMQQSSVGGSLTPAELNYMGRVMTNTTRMANMIDGNGGIIKNDNSDARMKDFDGKEKYFDSDKVRYILEKIGKLKEFNDEETVDDEVLAKYADYVHNYLYTYNDEALKVDPTTDTEQEHIGPMAQDLQQVNPATVEKDPESGYLTVNTGRLALMNAGAIAELARRLEALENEHST